MVYLGHARWFREEYLNKLMVLNEFFLVVQAGFMILFTTPYSTHEMDEQYCTCFLVLIHIVSIVMLVAYLQIVVTLVVAAIVQY
jgi:hypothetical protein